MSRTLPATVTSAISSQTTAPVYLIEFGFDPIVRAATWDADITWNGQTWSASGVEVSKLSQSGASIQMPNGASDQWLSLVTTGDPRGRSVTIYEHHTDTTASPQTDAVLVFSGIMDTVTIRRDIRVSVLESSQAKTFPPDSADPTVFTHLLTPGSQITWGNDTITVQ